jgi:hypothetical protein
MRIANATKKSNTNDPAAAIGRISRGKYTFETRLAFPTRVSEEAISDDAKSVHGTSAEYAKMG